MKYKNITICVIDNGLYFYVADRLSKFFKKTYYFQNKDKTFPTINHYKIGDGFENVELIDNLFNNSCFHDIDLFIFPDINDGHLQEYLVSIGKQVWGSRRGELMETDRLMVKKWLNDEDMPVGDYKLVKGVNNLRNYLQKHDDVFVKISEFRGLVESFHAENYHAVSNLIDKIQHDLGAYQNSFEFIVEDNLLDKIEVGMDTWIIADQNNVYIPSVVMSGIEIKDDGYYGRIVEYDDLPTFMKDIDYSLYPLFKKYKYKGFFSNEIRVGKDHEPYLIDIAARIPEPPGSTYFSVFENLHEIIYEGSKGNLTMPQYKAEYICQIVLKSHFSNCNWTPIIFPEEYYDCITIKNPCKIDDKYYCIPQGYDMYEIGAVVGYGSSYEAASEMAKEIASSIKGYGIKAMTGSCDSAQKEIDKMREEMDIDYL